MKLLPATEGRVILTIREIEPFFLDLLRRIPESANPADDPAARERLFSEPIKGDDEEDFNADWREYVQPDIRDLFRSAQEIVIGDLAALPPAPAKPERSDTDDEFDELPMDPTDFQSTGHYLEIPRTHAEAWVSVLNQARLVIAAKFEFGEPEMEEELPLPPFDERGYALFQIHLYDYLQEALLRALGFD